MKLNLRIFPKSRVVKCCSRSCYHYCCDFYRKIGTFQENKIFSHFNVILVKRDFQFLKASFVTRFPDDRAPNLNERLLTYTRIASHCSLQFTTRRDNKLWIPLRKERQFRWYVYHSSHTYFIFFSVDSKGISYLVITPKRHRLEFI